MKTFETFSQLVDFVAASERPVYVRWSSDAQGDIKRGYSTNHQTGEREAGLSVNNLTDIKHGLFSGPAYIAQQLVEYSYLNIGGTGALPWVCVGELAGYGSDNEPLLAGAEMVGYVSQAALDEAEAMQADERGERIRRGAVQYAHLLERGDVSGFIRCVRKRAYVTGDDVREVLGL